MNILDRATEAVEAAHPLDTPANAVANAVTTAYELTGRAAQPIQNALHGTWLGHPLHPALVTIPIGCWLFAFALDTGEELGLIGPDTARGADAALVTGSVGAVAAAATGLTDYRQLHGKDRRTGLAHAALNSTALALNLGSLALRGRGQRSAGKALSAAGALCVAAGAYLGGHMSYRRRIGTDQSDRSPEPRTWTPVLPLCASFTRPWSTTPRRRRSTYSRTRGVPATRACARSAPSWKPSWRTSATTAPGKPSAVKLRLLEGVSSRT